MSNSTANGAASKSTIFFDGAIPAAFDGAAVTAFWQSNATRWMQSSQILMRGLTEVVRLEAELGRSLLQVALAGIKTPSFGGKPEERAREQLGIAAQEFCGLITSLRKIADESRNVCNDATLALFETANRAAYQAEPAAPHAETVTKSRVAPVPAALARAAE